MGLSVYKGKLDCPGSTGNQSITDPGFQVKGSMFWCTNRTADGVGGELFFSMGFSDGTNQWAVGAAVDDAATPSSTTAAKSSSGAHVLYCRNPNNTGELFKAAMVSHDATGFTINWTTILSGMDVHYIVWGGTDLTNVFVGNFNGSNATGTQAITAPGFQGDSILAIGSNRAGGATAGGAAGVSFFLGAATGAAAQWSMGGGVKANVAAVSGRRLYTNQFITIPNSAGGNTIQGLASFLSWDATGFSIDWTDADANTIGYIVFKGMQVKVGTITQKTSTGSQVTSGVVFSVKALIAASIGSTTVGANIADFLFALGATTGPVNEGASWVGDNDGTTPVEADSASTSAAVIQIRDPGTTTILAEAETTSLDVDGWTLNYLTADATARVIGYVAFGEIAAGPANQVVWVGM